MPFSILPLPFCRGSVVIARGALSPRGNPETNKAFAVAVVVIKMNLRKQFSSRVTKYVAKPITAP
jgi:hypothetical protein